MRELRNDALYWVRVGNEWGVLRFDGKYLNGTHGDGYLPESVELWGEAFPPNSPTGNDKVDFIKGICDNVVASGYETVTIGFADWDRISDCLSSHSVVVAEMESKETAKVLLYRVLDRIEDGWHSSEIKGEVSSAIEALE